MSARLLFLKNLYLVTCLSSTINRLSPEAATGGVLYATLLKRRLWQRCFPVNFVKFLRKPFFTQHIWATAFILCKNQAPQESSLLYGVNRA